jgi:hypothetical protein
VGVWRGWDVGRWIAFLEILVMGRAECEVGPDVGVRWLVRWYRMMGRLAA